MKIAFDDLLKRTCRSCLVTKPAARFHHNAKCEGGLEKTCKDCKLERQRKWRYENPEMIQGYRRKSQLRHKFDMEVEDYERLLAAQGGVCRICLKACPSGRRLAVDHDHACCPGKVTCGKCIRGLLCTNCNKGLGHFMDDPDLLDRAKEYLAS